MFTAETDTEQRVTYKQQGFLSAAAAQNQSQLCKKKK